MDEREPFLAASSHASMATPATETTTVLSPSSSSQRQEDQDQRQHVVGGEDLNAEKAYEAFTRYNVYLVSVAFLVLFAAFNTLQNYATSLFPGNLGYHSLATLYATVCVVVPFAPAVVRRIDERRSMIVGAWLYVAWMVSLIHIVPAVVLFASVLIGAGAAVLWVGQGSFLIKLSPPHLRGFWSGRFWSVFQVCNVVGNCCAYFVFNHTSKGVLLASFSVCGACGALMMHAIRWPPPPWSGKPMDTEAVYGTMEDDDEVQNALPPFSPSEILVNTVRLIRNPHVLLLLPAFFLTGYELAFWTGEFPRLLKDHVIGLVLMFAGLGEIIGGLTISPLSDRIGKSKTMVFGTVCFFGAALGLTALLKQKRVLDPVLFEAPLIAYFAALCFGIADSTFNTHVYALLGRVSEVLHKSTGDRGAVVGTFTIFQLFQNFGSAVGFYYSPLFPLHGEDGTMVQVYLQGGVALVACVLYVIADRRLSSTVY